MLRLSRTVGGWIRITVNGEVVFISVESVGGKTVQLGFSANPNAVKIDREEIAQSKDKDKSRGGSSGKR